MATIEERAYEHYPIDLQKSNDMEVSLKNEAGWDGYVLGATEQRPITKQEMIEKATQTMESFMSFYGIDRDVMLRISKDVRKAMEE